MRLTKRNDGTGSWTQLGDKYLPAHNIKHKQCVNKLGQLEDIEEELGIDLITLFQAILLKGIYVRCGKTYEHIPPKDLWLRTDVSHYSIDFLQSDCRHCLADYGKTWALTEEELL